MFYGVTLTKEAVLDELKNGEATGMTIKQLEENISYNHESIRRRLLELIEDGEVTRERDTNDGKRSFVYKLVASEPEQEEEPKMEKPERYGDNKNDEGYPDPTFAKAIKNLDRFNDIMPGGIYGTSLGVGDSFLVVRTYPDCALGYYVREVALAKSTDTTTAWQTKKGTSYVHVNQLMSVPFRKLDKHKFERMPLDAYKEIIRKSPLQAAKVVPVEIEKIVEKEVPVEKEVIKEVPAELTIEGCYEYLRDSGWLDEHDKAVIDMDAAKRILRDPTDLTEDICIEFLQNSGWLPEHDKSIAEGVSANRFPYEDGDVVDGFKIINGAHTVSEILNDIDSRNLLYDKKLLEQKVEIYENIIKVLLPGFMK